MERLFNVLVPMLITKQSTGRHVTLYKHSICLTPNRPVYLLLLLNGALAEKQLIQIFKSMVWYGFDSRPPALDRY